MPSPFPGMDPYLERAGMWEEVRTRLIVVMADALGPHVRPKYRMGVEQRTYLAVMTPDEYELVGKPDVLVVASRHQAQFAPASGIAVSVTPHVAELPMPEEITERYLVVREVVTGEVITVIKLLSPTNKLTREGRLQYERKRLQVLGSATHLIEIDLLRAGAPFPFRVRDPAARSDYRILVSRAPIVPRPRCTSLPSVIPPPLFPCHCNLAKRSPCWP